MARFRRSSQRRADQEQANRHYRRNAAWVISDEGKRLDALVAEAEGTPSQGWAEFQQTWARAKFMAEDCGCELCLLAWKRLRGKTFDDAGAAGDTDGTKPIDSSEKGNG